MSAQSYDLVVIGTTLGGYKILSKLGTGGMGAVFLAESVDSQARTAIKVVLVLLIVL